MVPKKFTAKITQTIVMAQSIGQMSSAYSLRLGEPERKGEGGGDDDELPAPEVEPGEQVDSTSGS